MTDLTPDELRRYREIAEAATPGPWKRCCSCHNIDDASGDSFAQVFYQGHVVADLVKSKVRISVEAADANATHIATFSPDTALLLLDMAERTARAESERDRLLGIFGDFDAPCHSATLAEAVWNDVRSRCIAAEADVERLRAVLRWVAAVGFDSWLDSVMQAAADGRWDIVPPEAKGERRG